MAATADGKVNIIVKAKDETGGVFSKISGNFQSLGKTALLGAGAGIAAVGAAITGVAVKGTKDFIAFEDQMNEVFTLLPGISEPAMRQMRDQVLAASQDMGRLPEEIVPALYQSLSAGVPPDNVFEFLDQAHKAALGGVTELETAVDGISSVVNAYGSDVIDASKASDLMFTAVRLGKTDFGQLSASLSNVTPIASAMGVSFDDITAALATMTAQGTPTAQATTQMRALLQELGTSGTEVADTFEDIAGKSFLDFIAEGGNVSQALQMLEQHANATGIPLQDMFGNVRAGLGALQLSGNAAETYASNLEEMAGSAGATDAAFETMNSGMARTLEVIKAKFATTFIRIGEAMAPIVKTLGEKLVGALDKVLPLVRSFFNALSPLLDAIFNGGDILDALQMGVEGIGEALGFSWDEIDAFNVKLKEWWQAGEDLIDQLVDFKDQLIEWITPIWDAVTGFVELKDVLAALGVVLAVAIVPVVAGLVTSVGSILAPILLLVGIIALLRTAWQKDWLGIKTALTAVWEGTLKPKLEELQAWLQEEIPKAIEKLKQFWEEKLLPAIQIVVGWLEQKLVPFLRDVLAWYIGVYIPKIIEILKNAWENILLPAIMTVWEWLSGTLIPFIQNTLIPWLEENIPKAIETLRQFWEEKLLPAIETVWAFISETLIPILQDLANNVIEGIKSAIQTLSDYWQNTLLPAIQKVWAFIQDDLIPLFNALKELIDVGLSLALTALQGLWENVLLPAIQAVWGFINDNVVPILTDLKDLIETGLNIALEALRGLWEDTLLPAIESVWQFIQDNLIPVFQSIIDKIKEKLQPALETVTGVFDSVRDAISNISGVVQSVIGWIESLTTKLGQLTLPDWLTPGSPTPFELGLRGISSALQELSSSRLPRFESKLNISEPSFFNQAPVAVSGSPASVQEFHLHINGDNMDSHQIISEFETLKSLVIE